VKNSQNEKLMGLRACSLILLFFLPNVTNREEKEACRASPVSYFLPNPTCWKSMFDLLPRTSNFLRSTLCPRLLGGTDWLLGKCRKKTTRLNMLCCRNLGLRRRERRSVEPSVDLGGAAAGCLKPTIRGYYVRSCAGGREKTRSDKETASKSMPSDMLAFLPSDNVDHVE
jgi:hypothetical protein